MKKLLRLFLVAAFVAVVGAQTVKAQIPGRIYHPGDTMIIDGMFGLVFMTNESGLHGKVISSRYMRGHSIQADIDKDLEKVGKDLAKKVKKEKMSQEEMDRELAAIKNMSRFPAIEASQVRNYKALTEYRDLLPEGWRFPNYEDCNDISMFHLELPLNERKGALGHRFNPKTIGVNSLTWMFYNVFMKGLIAEINNDVQYLSFTNGGMKVGWFLDNEYSSQFGAFIKDF